MGNKTCPKCNIAQQTITDDTYLETNGNCWACDRDKWVKGKLSLKEFESRESLAFDK